MATPSDLANQLLIGRAYNFTPQQQKNLMAAQQQEQMANALLQQGMTPISTDNRSIGGVGYAISPWEGVNKLAQAGIGGYDQQHANSALADALLRPAGSAPSGQSSGNDSTVLDKLPSDIRDQYAQWSLPESLGGNPRAAEGLLTAFAGPTPEQKNFGPNMAQNIQNQLGHGYMEANPGMASMQTGLGTSAAQNAPVGTMPSGAPQMAPQPAAMQPQAGPPMPPQGGPQIPPIAASALQPPVAPGGPMPNAPSGPAPVPVPSPQISPASGMPAPMPGESNLQYQNRLEAAKAAAIAQGAVGPAGAKTQAEDTGKNIADAVKTYNVAAGNLPRAMQRFEQLRQAVPNASYGGGVNEEEPGAIMGDYARNFARTSGGQLFEPKTAIANQTLEQATKQGILSELGPQLAGLRGNKFLESIASGASGLNLADPPPAKLNAINGLQDQYISNLKSLATQRRSYGDTSAPSDMDLATTIAQSSPTAMVSVISPDGKQGKVSALHLPDLIKSGGQIQ